VGEKLTGPEPMLQISHQRTEGTDKDKEITQLPTNSATPLPRLALNIVLFWWTEIGF
jgi:hypothetical protein